MRGISTGVSTEAIDYLFSSTSANSQANLDALAGNLLGQGIDFYQKGDYDRAINAFRRSAALSPFSDNTAKAYDYMGKAYLKQEKTAEAIKVYKEAIRIYPTRDEFHLALGDIYLKDEGRQEEALKAYRDGGPAEPELRRQQILTGAVLPQRRPVGRRPRAIHPGCPADAHERRRLLRPGTDGAPCRGVSGGGFAARPGHQGE